MSMHSLFLYRGHEVEVVSITGDTLQGWTELGEDETGNPDVNLVSDLSKPHKGLEEYRVCDTCEERGPHELCRNQRCEAREYLEALQGRDHE